MRLDPLGWLPEMRAIAAIDTSTGYEDLYRMLLIDTPVGADTRPLVLFWLSTITCCVFGIIKIHTGPYFEAYIHSQTSSDP